MIKARKWIREFIGCEKSEKTGEESSFSSCWTRNSIFASNKGDAKGASSLVDKPLIQYAAEEAVGAGIDTLIFVTGRIRDIEDHFDANSELDMP